MAKPLDPAALAQVLASHAVTAAGPAMEGSGADLLDTVYFGALAEALGPAKIAEIVAGVAEDARPHCERLAGARGRADLGEVRAAAHALRGIATNLGLVGLARLTAAIEDASQAGAGGRVASLCERVDACVAASIERLGALQAGR